MTEKSEPSEYGKAINDLYQARPDIEKVKALTAETLAAKKEAPVPFEFDAVFYEYGTKTSRSTYIYCCKLCGVEIETYVATSRMAEFARKHYDWHNSMERRLRKIEEWMGQPPTPEQPEQPAQPEHHPEGNCFARAERSYTSQPHELNVNGPYGKFTRNPE